MFEIFQMSASSSRRRKEREVEEKRKALEEEKNTLAANALVSNISNRKSKAFSHIFRQAALIELAMGVFNPA
jgi:hypothetical protein